MSSSSKGEQRFSMRVDEDTLVALRRLANADERTLAAQLRYMIRREAVQRGLWTPGKPLGSVQPATGGP